MCIDLIRKLFRKPKTPAPTTLPHPEEKPDYSQTMSNVNIDAMFQSWYANYNVPAGNQDYFRNKVVVELSDTISNPAETYELNGIRHLIIRPEWCNAGVLAHEQAHNSYALLTEDQKITFETAYNAAQFDPYIVLLHTVNTYMNSLDAQGRHVEGHAELYRYIGLEKLPETLKQFYPKLS